MPRTDLENLQKRRWASKYWRELPVSTELERLAQHELTYPVEARILRRAIKKDDAEALARQLTAHRYLLTLREREKLAFAKAYPLTTRLRAAA